MNAILCRAFTDIAIGTPIQGGLFAGAYSIDGTPYGLVASTKAAGDLEPAVWIDRYKDVPGALSFVDGRGNTAAMAAAGSKLAKKILALDIGGFTDWFLPAQDESELLYRAFKPTVDENSQWARSGINVSALVPTYPYTPTFPLQTTIEAFRAGGAEAFVPVGYWTSTQHASDSDDAWCQDFDDGDQNDWSKYGKLRARAVRRLTI